MGRFRRGLIAVGLLLAGVAAAKAPQGQGRACDSRDKCEAGLQCVAHRERSSTCELMCNTSANCPEEQRCVNDGSRKVCRPIYDGTW